MVLVLSEILLQQPSVPDKRFSISSFGRVSGQPMIPNTQETGAIRHFFSMWYILQIATLVVSPSVRTKYSKILPHCVVLVLSEILLQQPSVPDTRFSISSFGRFSGQPMTPNTQETGAIRHFFSMWYTLQIATLVVSPSVRTEYRKESTHGEVVLGHVNVCDLIVTVSTCVVSPRTDINFP